MIAYKIVDEENGKIKTLYHGVNGSRVLERDRWYQAEIKMVSENGPKYLSGFHIFKGLEECREYIKKFKNKENKIVIKCECKKVRKKEHSPNNVFLCEKMKVLEIV